MVNVKEKKKKKKKRKKENEIWQQHNHIKF